MLFFKSIALEFRLWLFGQSLDADKYDLRHFQWVQWSDTWNGRSTSFDGYTTRVLLYRGQPVYEETKVRNGGSREGTGVQGCDAYCEIARVAMHYLRTIRILRHLAGVEEMIEFSPRFQMVDRDAEVLMSHHQFKELLAYWPTEGWDVGLKKLENNCMYEVTAIKTNTQLPNKQTLQSA